MDNPQTSSNQACWCGHAQRQHHWTGACVECALDAWNNRESPVNANHSFSLNSPKSPGGYRISSHSLSQN